VGEYEIDAASLLYWLNYQVENYLQQLQSMGYPITEIPWDSADETGTTMAESALAGALDAAALYAILPILAEDAEVELPQDDLDMPEKFLTQLETQLGSKEAANHLLWSQMMDAEHYTNFYLDGCRFKLLTDYYYGEGSENYPTDAEVKGYAENDLGYYYVKHILLSIKDAETGEELDQAGKDAKRATAMDLLDQLRKADDPVALFDTLMNEYSEDPGLASYPDGYEAYKGQMVAEFEQASLALKDGEISEIVESAHGYHIILRLPLDLDSFRESLIYGLMDQRVADILYAYGVNRTESFEQIDPASFRANVVALQAAVETELQAIMDAKAQANSETPGSAG